MEYKKAKVLTILRSLLFLAGIGMVIYGQRHIGYPGLFLMLGGLAIMLLIIFDYNNRNK